jgi:hypothetical protein
MFLQPLRYFPLFTLMMTTDKVVMFQIKFLHWHIASCSYWSVTNCVIGLVSGREETWPRTHSRDMPM